MGAAHFIATDKKDFAKGHELEFDLIVCSASSSKLPLDELFSMLDIHCKLVFVGMPEEGLQNITSQTLSGNGAALASSHIGNKQEAIQMLNLAAEKKVKPWINVIQMKDVAQAIKAVEDNSVRYRTILIQVRGTTAAWPCQLLMSLGHRAAYLLDGLGAVGAYSRC